MNISKGTALLIGLTTAVVLCKSCCVISEAIGAQPLKSISNAVNTSSFTYKLSGTSDLTKERVIAYLNQREDDPSRLEGILYEGMYLYHIQAIWNGKGTAYARSIVSTYQLEVIE
jgi:hypothetical protein